MVRPVQHRCERCTHCSDAALQRAPVRVRRKYEQHVRLRQLHHLLVHRRAGAESRRHRLRDAGREGTELFWIFLPIVGSIILIVHLAEPSVATTVPPAETLKADDLATSD